MQSEAMDKNNTDSNPMIHDHLPSVKGIDLINYVDESQLEDVMRLVGQDLSEPYSSKLFQGLFRPVSMFTTCACAQH